ncbi:MAG: primosomal protein N' [Schaalia hyovaginalis]|uniref:primosomal protein N' family DNA-binding protein n=1 Tax=Schaalia hyovaginalis TaxID=29316 RepID=UPI0023F6C622|nr:primosomal protein N' [Schaalia hyovaginalis]MCI7672071.1 primosomal protein N' [Schaalia hyovaginalis]MDY6213314.1 primosomal protein N' [Schaalia hyovaginalis]
MDEQIALEGFAPASAEAAPVAAVLVDIDLPHLDRPLDYSVPDALAGEVEPGRIVRVSLAGKRRFGWVVEVKSASPLTALAPIERVVSRTPVLTPGLIDVARRIAQRNLATLSQTLSLAIPVRHATTEKDVLASPLPALAACRAPDAAPWQGVAAAPALLERIGAGRAPRAVWTALGPKRDARIVELVAAAAHAGRGVLLIAPTSAQARAMAELLTRSLGAEVRLIDSESTPAHRYRVHLEAMKGFTRIVVGTRSAVWTPLANLGLILVWDDGDDRLREQRAPRCDALDVAVARSHIEGCALVAAAYSRSVKAQRLVETGWAVSLVEGVEARRGLSPIVRVADEVDAEAQGPAGAMRISPWALRTIREGLASGPVLVQVGASGYVPVVSCDRCRAIAHCPYCSGPVSKTPDSHFACAWCSRPMADWRCPKCSGTRLRHTRVGSERTAEEIARAMPTASVLASSSTHAITRRIPADPQVVIATAGAEPEASGGYAALVILDARAIAGRAELWAPEEAMRRWFNALALVRPGAPALVASSLETAMAQALIRFDPVDYAQRLLDERTALGYFPAKTLIAIDGPGPDVAAVAQAAQSEVIGTIPIGSDDERAPRARALVRCDHADSAKVFANIWAVMQHRSSKRLPPLRLTVNPPELF